METESGQNKEVRNIHCLLCNVSKPFRGFLSHIRDKHLNYQRYKCTRCMFKSDDEDDSVLHSFRENHDLKFDNSNYQEHLAVKIFQDCCREELAMRRRMRKHENFVSEQTNKRSNWDSRSDIQKVSNPKKTRVKANDACFSSSLKYNQSDCRVTSNPTRLLNGAKPELEIHSTKILSKAGADSSKPCKLSEPNEQAPYVFGLFSGALENTATVSSDKLLNAHPVNVLSSDGKGKSDRNTSGPKERTVENASVPQIAKELSTTCHKCGKDVGVNYIAKKTHALQFHFVQSDDPEIAELLPATIKACFPHSLSWSDYQCTECGKALGTYGSRRNHVLKEHFYWSAICPLPGCTAVISALGNLEKHFKLEHNISQLKMPKGLKQKLRKVENDRKNDLHRKLIHCFPCSLPPKRQVIVKESACDSRHLPRPSITSVLSSLLHSEQTNIVKKNFTYLSSDTESSSVEDEDDSGIKGEDHDIVN